MSRCPRFRPWATRRPTTWGWERPARGWGGSSASPRKSMRSEEHTSELQSLAYLVCRLLLEKKKQQRGQHALPGLQDVVRATHLCLPPQLRQPPPRHFPICLLTHLPPVLCAAVSLRAVSRSR